MRMKTQLGIKVNGNTIDMLGFADDIDIIAESEKHLKKNLGTVENKHENERNEDENPSL